MVTYFLFLNDVMRILLHGNIGFILTKPKMPYDVIQKGKGKDFPMSLFNCFKSKVSHWKMSKKTFSQMSDMNMILTIFHKITLFSLQNVYLYFHKYFICIIFGILSNIIFLLHIFLFPFYVSLFSFLFFPFFLFFYPKTGFITTTEDHLSKIT